MILTTTVILSIAALDLERNSERLDRPARTVQHRRIVDLFGEDDEPITTELGDRVGWWAKRTVKADGGSAEHGISDLVAEFIVDVVNRSKSINANAESGVLTTDAGVRYRCTNRENGFHR